MMNDGRLLLHEGQLINLKTYWVASQAITTKSFFSPLPEFYLTLFNDKIA